MKKPKPERATPEEIKKAYEDMKRRKGDNPYLSFEIFLEGYMACENKLLGE